VIVRHPTTMTAMRAVASRIMRFVLMVSGCGRGDPAVLASMDTVSAGHSCNPRAG